MATTFDTLTRTPQRLTATFLCLTSVAVVAGGAGGYLIHGASTAPQAVPVVAAPAAAPQRALNADSGSGYGASTSVGTPSRGLNSDSAGGYRASTSSGAPARALNADSSGGY